MGMVIAAISKRVFDLAGLIPALLLPGFMLVVDPRPRIMVREILTEDVSCYLVVVLFFALLLWKNRHTYWSTAIVGGTRRSDSVSHDDGVLGAGAGRGDVGAAGREKIAFGRRGKSCFADSWQ